jgi:hypothetical protein
VAYRDSKKCAALLGCRSRVPVEQKSVTAHSSAAWGAEATLRPCAKVRKREYPVEVLDAGLSRSRITRAASYPGGDAAPGRRLVRSRRRSRGTGVPPQRRARTSMSHRQQERSERILRTPWPSLAPARLPLHTRCCSFSCDPALQRPAVGGPLDSGSVLPRRYDFPRRRRGP